jgi:single-stranded-DNA-specific exonuclease
MRIKRREIPEGFPLIPNIPTFLQRIYAARGIRELSELNTELQALLPFHALKGIKDACLRLESALRKQERILIIGDFDADGATSTALAVSTLKIMGAKHVEYLVPNRFEFGYGLTPGIVEVAARWKPDLIITVDNGIASIEGVDKANSLHIDVLITDHHLPAETVPNACAIVNPNQVGCLFESKSLAGVGVIFYVMLALRRHLVEVNWFSEINIPEPNMAHALDLVALGTVADVVGLDANNRTLVSQGLKRMRQGLCRAGIKALLEVSGRDLSRLKESDLGFAVAPRLNAAGRLDDMSLGIECLLAENDTMAASLAEQLDALNVERRQIESEMKEQAMLALDKLSLNSEQLPLILCLYDKTWHQGVIGILAGRLKERYHRPVLAFAKVSDTEMKGSARSIAGINIRDILAEVDKNHPKLMGKYGGHAMAAGVSLHPDAFDAFKKALELEISKHLTRDACQGELLTDGPLSPDAFHLQTAESINAAGPWGQGFPEPLFDGVFELLEQRIVGKNHLKMTLLPENGNEPIDAIAFNIDLKAWPNHRARQIHAAFKLDINVYQNRKRLQLMVEAMQAVNSV